MPPSTPTRRAPSASRRAARSDELVDQRRGQRHRHRQRGPAEGVRHVRAGALGPGSRRRRARHRAGARQGNCRSARGAHRGDERRARARAAASRCACRAPRRLPRRRRRRPGRAQRPCRPNKRILLADDNRDAAESLAIILRLEGHEVELAHDGLAALRAFEATQAGRGAARHRHAQDAMATRSRGRSARCRAATECC